MSRTYTTLPLRFSPNSAAMIDFFTALGLRKTLAHEDQTYATFDGATGSLGVHSAERTDAGEVPLHTALNLATADLEAAATELRCAGIEVRVWDETYGRQGVVLTQAGLAIGLNQDTQDDLYGGYKVPAQEVASSLDVVVICLTDDVERDSAFFAAFGYAVESSDPAGVVRLRAGADSGIVLLRPGQVAPSGSIRDDRFGPPYLVDLGFETSEPLDAFAARLMEAGYAAQTVEGEAGPYVSLVDPDGVKIDVNLTH